MVHCNGFESFDLAIWQSAAFHAHRLARLYWVVGHQEYPRMSRIWNNQMEYFLYEYRAREIPKPRIPKLDCWKFGAFSCFLKNESLNPTAFENLKMEMSLVS